MPFSLPDRIRALPAYLFVQIDRKKQALLDAGKDVISFGVGDPDTPTCRFVIDALKRAVENPAYHRYPHDLGLPMFRQRVAEFMAQRYGVTVDPRAEVLTLIGTKEGLGHLSLAVLNPGDVSLTPDPGYPVYRSGALFAGATPIDVPLREDLGWLPDLDAIPADAARRARLLFLNYPNNPTGGVASLEFFARAVAWARRNDVLICHDAAYNEMYFEHPAPSILQVDGARAVAVELHSLSKTFQMTGWRLGFAVGNADALAALARIKSNLDSGQFSAVQEAGAVALAQVDGAEVRATRAMYQQRARRMAEGLRTLGFRIAEPRATFYIWAGAPAGYSSLDVVNKLLDEAAIVSVPGGGFGRGGEGFVRFALTVDERRIAEALERMQSIRW